MNAETNEEWRDIPDLDLYEVSNFGRIRRKPQILSGGTTPSGHLTVALSKGRGKGKPKSMYIHRLVALAFLENPENFPLVNHKDGNPKNNNVENLEWCTYSQNILHGYRSNGRRTPFEMKVMAIDDNGEVVMSFRSMADAGKLFNVTAGSINSAVKRKGKSVGYYWVKYADI